MPLTCSSCEASPHPLALAQTWTPGKGTPPGIRGRDRGGHNHQVPPEPHSRQEDCTTRQSSATSHLLDPPSAEEKQSTYRQEKGTKCVQMKQVIRQKVCSFDGQTLSLHQKCMKRRLDTA